MAATNVVPAAGQGSTIGSPPAGSGVLPTGWDSMAAKTVANVSEMNLNSAARLAIFNRVLNVLGREQMNERMVVIATNIIAQAPWLVMMLRYFAPTKQCNPDIGTVCQLGTTPSIACPSLMKAMRKGFYLNENIVEQKHYCHKVPCNSRIPEEVLANIANILNFRVSKAELPGHWCQHSFRKTPIPTYQMINEAYNTTPATPYKNRQNQTGDMIKH